MTFSKLRPVEFVAATFVSVAILLVAIAPSLVAARPGSVPAPGLHVVGHPGIESRLAPEWRLV